MRTLTVLSVLAISVASAATIEQYLGAPFASELHAAPGGGKVVWILNERGARNLWVAGAPDYKGRRLTAYKDDDGQDIGQISWTEDGRSIIFTRGGDLEFLGRDNPNPRNLATMPEQAIFVISFDGGAPKRIAWIGFRACVRHCASMESTHCFTRSSVAASPRNATVTRSRFNWRSANARPVAMGMVLPTIGTAPTKPALRSTRCIEPPRP